MTIPPTQVHTLYDLILTRRSIRRYLPDRVPDALIARLLDAAVWAPSAHNRQPWRFCVVTTSETKRALADAMGERLRADLARDGVSPEVIDADAGRSYQRITGAPALVLVSLTMAEMDAYPDAARAGHEYLMAAQSTAMAAGNLLLAAHEAGLGACWMCAPLFCPDVVRDALRLPSDWHPQALITLGYPAETKVKTRKPAESSTLWR
jgi:F420 biosynthesis protein FbiB-like protein